MPARRVATPPHHWLEAGLALGVVLLVALALRWPHLQLVPHVTDESGEVLWAYNIAFHGARPLVHLDAYNGPFWPYLLAATLRLVPPSTTWPRLFTLILGLGAIVATYALAAALTGPGTRVGAALIAGLLMATNFTHALVNSRVAWSNSTTPLWTTLTALIVVLAVQRQRPAWLVLGGLAGGLALNTHPSVSVFLTGLGVWFVLTPERRAWLRTPWPWLGVLAGILAYSPVIVHNATHGLASITEARASRNFATESGVVWPSGVGALLGQFGRVLAGGFTPGGPDPAWGWVSALYAAFGLGVVVLLARDRVRLVGRRLPVCVTLTAVLVLPLFNSNWQGLLESRYLAFLLPFVFAAAGALASEAWARHARFGRLVVALGLGVLIAMPAIRVWQHDAAALAQQFDNRRLLAMVAALEAAPSATPVQVDEALKDVPWRAGGNPRRAMEYYLTLAGIAFDRTKLAAMNAKLAHGRYWLLLAGATADSLGTSHALGAVNDGNRPGEARWGLYDASAP